MNKINQNINGTFAIQKYSDHEDLLKAIECPECLKIPTPPILTCTKGHIICGPCRNIVSKCKICSSKFTTVPNEMSDKFANLLELKCKNLECTEKLRAKDLNDHQKMCPYRPIPCFESRDKDCYGKLIEFHKYVRHLETFHQVTTQAPEQPFYRIRYRTNLKKDNETTFQVSHLSFDKKSFFVKNRIIGGNSYITVTCLAPESDLTPYYSIVRSYGNQKQIPRAETVVPVHSIRMDHSSIDAMGHTVFFSRRFLAAIGVPVNVVGGIKERDEIEYNFNFFVSIEKL